MAECQFSETQFVMGFLGEYFNQYRLTYPGRKPPFTVPTTSMEPMSGSDFIIQGLSNIQFFQFKRSELMRVKRGDREIASGLPKSFRPYYRFKIYNSGNIPQFDRLRYIASLHPRFKTYYCAPKFSTNQKFHDFFWNQGIIDNSAIINCDQFNQSRFLPPNFDINDGDLHYMVFNNASSIGYICSERRDFNLTKNILKESQEQGFGEVVKYEYSVEIIERLYNSIIQMEDINIKFVERYGETPLSKLFFSSGFLMEKYGIITQLKFD